MKEEIGNKKFLTRREYAKFAMQDSVSFGDDEEPLIYKYDYQSDKSFDELGTMCIDDAGDSPKQEGSL